MTCEEYIIDKLEKAEEKAKKLDEIKRILKENVSYNRLPSGTNAINFSALFDNYDKRDYNFMKSFLEEGDTTEEGEDDES